MTSPRIRRRTGAAVATGLTAALALSGLAAAPAFAAAPAAVPADASPTAGTVSDAVFQWGLNKEVGNRAFAPGTFNFLSAGIAPKSDGADTISESEWKAAEGNVSILKPDTGGAFSAATWANIKTDPSGAAITSPTSGKYSGVTAAISAGTGTLDAEADDADIQWDGDFTVAFYSGMTQFSISDPHLVVENGTGSVTATLNGYGTDMSDTSVFTALPTQEVTIATLSAVDVTPTGIASSPDYLGVALTMPAKATPQVTTGDAWGAFPQGFVDYQLNTGQSSYWYSSGGSTDAAKVATPVTVAYTVTPAAAVPTVTVSKTTNLNPTGETITVTGTGFLPNAPATTGTRPPLAGKFAGAYVTFGTFLDTWKASEGAPSSARKSLSSSTKWVMDAADVSSVGGANAGAIALDAKGGFSITMTVQKGFSGALADGNFGVYTYPASGANYAPFETFTPITFADPAVDRIQGADRIEVAVNVSKKAYPTESGSDVAYIVTGSTFADALSAAPAAVKEKAPLLLTAPDALPASVKAELQRLSPGKIVIVGGPNSVSTTVEAELEQLATTVERISGADRYEASRNVVKTVFGIAGVKNAYVATGANFPDALSASAAGGSTATPVLLVNGGASSIDTATSTLLTTLGIDTVSIAGGPNSVSEGVKTSIEALNGKTDPTKKVVVTRLSGADRFAASISINNSAFTWANTVYLATGYNYPDALAGAALAGLKGSPLYVVPGDCVPQGVLGDIERLGAGQVTLLGGPNSLSPKVASLTPCTL